MLLVIAEARLCSRLGLFIWLLSFAGLTAAQVLSPLYIGLNADLSSAASPAGKAIEKGALLAIEEINQQQLLKHPLKLISRDHRGNPRRGRDNLLDFSQQKNLIAVLAGVHTPVALAELEIIHQQQLIYLIPWAAGTGLVENHYRPNYVFRLSVNDKHAAPFLIASAQRLGLNKPGLLLENTGWGRSNAKSAQSYLQTHHLKPNSMAFFNWGAQDFRQQLKHIKQQGSDYVLLVANATEASFVLKSMLELPSQERLPIISHWGITSGDLLQQDWLKKSDIELHYLQTVSFKQELARLKQSNTPLLGTQLENAKLRFVHRYCQRFPNCQQELKPAYAMGSAHAYDLIHLLARAVQTSPNLERNSIHQQLESHANYHGIMPTLQHVFSPKRHDALAPSSYQLVKYPGNHASLPIKVNR